MKTLLCLLAIAAALAAQTPTLTLPTPMPVTPGETVTVPITIMNSAGNIAAFQNTLALSPSLPFTAISAPSLTTKTYVAVSPAGLPTTILVVGIVPTAPTVTGGTATIPSTDTFNATPIPDGSQVEQVTVTIPTTATTGTVYTLTAANVFAADGTGTMVAASGSSVTLTVTDWRTAATQAFDAWLTIQSQANFVTLIKAISAAQGH